MKSRDIAIVGILLAIGAIVRYLSLLVPGPIVSNLVIAFYCLAIILIIPTVKEAVGIGIVSGVVCALISHSVFPPGNLISEPIGAIVCLGVILLLRDRIVVAPAITTFIATLASGLTFVAIAIMAQYPVIVGKYGTIDAFLIVTVPIVLLAAGANGVVAQALYMPASRVLMRTQYRLAPGGGEGNSSPAVRNPKADAPISMSNVSYTYPQGTRPALAGIDLDVARGECLLVTGPTGAGKTTLCLAASGILYHEYGGAFAGNLSIAGKDVAAYRDMGEIGKKVGVVFDDADAQLIFTTVEEEVVSGLENQGLDRAEMQRRMDYVTDVTGIAHLLERAPHTLSGGQKQRVTIAATLALGTDLLILDEPTAELDTIATEAILGILQRLKEEGKTIVIVEHKVDELSRLADRMILIEDGKIAAEGAPDVLLKSERVRSLIEVDDAPEPEILPAAPMSAPAQPSAGISPIITIRGLVHRYGEATALAGVDLEILPGDIVAIVGENGSGKTTLVKHLNGLLRPTEGTVLVDGLDAATTPVTELARHVGLVFQNPDTMLFAETVEEEIAFGLSNIGLADHRELIDAVLAEVGLADHRNQYPRSLSRGERQSLALACVIAMRPKVIVLDEPTTGLDARETQRVMEIVQRLQREGCTILMVTHNMRLVREYADRIIAMEDGIILRDVRNFEEIACQKLCSISTGTATSTV